MFESDDWGAIRTRDKATFTALQKAGLSPEQSKYDSLDALERKEDLEALFQILSGFKDKNSKPPIFTFNTILTNPDFQKIGELEFENYYYRDLFESYQYWYGESNRLVWSRAIDENLIYPQFHAREHLNAWLWLQDLKAGNKPTLTAFEHDFFGLKTKTSSKNKNNYLATYHYENPEEKKFVFNTLKDGLNLFESIFGFKSRSFIASNYIWSHELEEVLKEFGVKFIQGQRVQLIPNPKFGLHKKYHYTGQRNRNGQIYMVRNVLFEPYLDQDKDWGNHALGQINNAFFWGKPAIISTHRINYSGQMDADHRDKSLKKLNNLLKSIIKKWPEVEFLSSGQLGNLMDNT